MAADAVPRTRRRQTRFVTALLLVVGVVAAAFALVQLVATRRHAAPAPASGPAQVPLPPTESRPGAPTADIPVAAEDSAETEPDHGDHGDHGNHEDGDSLEEWTVARLRTRARELGITGYSRMRKAELVAALRDAVG